jgi:hypothetical protein
LYHPLSKENGNIMSNGLTEQARLVLINAEEEEKV